MEVIDTRIFKSDKLLNNDKKQKMGFKKGEFHHSEETKMKIRLLKLGKKHSKEQTEKAITTSRKNNSYRKKGEFHHSEETREKLRLTGFKKGNEYWKEYGFKKGNKPPSYIDGKCKERGKQRKYIKGIRYSHIIWCSKPENFYRVPEGCIIHHINRNSSDDRIENLQIMTKDFHNRLHHEYNKLLKKEVII
jgi:hypothetical protein